MNQSAKVEIGVGITVFIGLLILVLGIFWGKGTDWVSDKKVYFVQFKDIYGLQKGDNVMVRGIQKGKVQKVLLHRDKAQVYFWVYPDITIHSDYHITVENKELMGGKQLAINPGVSDKIMPENTLLTGERGGDPVTLMSDLTKTLTRVDTVLSRLNTVMDVQRIDDVFDNLDETLNSVHEFMSETRSHLKQTFDHANRLATQLERDSTIFHTTRVINKLDSTLLHVNNLMHQIKNPASTLGKLTTESTLYDSLLITVRHMDSLMQDIKKNPKRYIHLEIF